MHEIKIYGYISNVAEQGDKDVSLLTVQEQLNSAEGKDILCRINSHGGDAEEGFAIYYELRRYAKENNAKIKTFAESRLGSIATIIFLAGDQRELTKDLQPFVHKAYFNTEDDITDSQKKELEVLNTRLAKHYSEHTELSFEEAYSLMENETSITTSEAEAMRFATSVENVLRPVALQRFNINKLDMNTNPKTPSILAKTMAFLKGLGAVNKILFDATGVEIDFYELADDEIAEVGAKARIDGKDADGSYVMTDGSTYVFMAGELTEIVAKAEDNVNEEAVALQAEIDTLTERLESVTNASTAKIEALQTTLAQKEAIIVNYKNIVSAGAGNDLKQKPENAKPINKNVAIDNAIKNLIKN